MSELDYRIALSCKDCVMYVIANTLCATIYNIRYLPTLPIKLLV